MNGNSKKIINLKEEEEKLLNQELVMRQTADWFQMEFLKRVARLKTLAGKLNAEDVNEEIIDEWNRIQEELKCLENKGKLEEKELEKFNQKRQELFKLKQKQNLQAALKKINDLEKKFY